MAKTLPWLKVSADLREHEKSVRLGALLHDQRAWSYVVGLWMWCAEQQPDGHVRGPEAAAMVEFGAGWSGPAGQLADAMRKVGFLEHDGEGGIVVHDWATEQAAHVEKRAKEAKRKAKYRASKAASAPNPAPCPTGQDAGPTTGHAADVPGDVPRPHENGEQRVEKEAAAAARASAREAAAQEAGGGDGAVLSGPGKLAECQAPPSPPAPPAVTPTEQIPADGETGTTVPQPPASASPKPMLDEDDFPSRPLVLEDATGERAAAPEPYPHATAFRRAVEAKYRAPRRYIANLTLPEWSELDELVRWAGGVEAAVAWFAERPADAKNATSLRYYLAVFGDERRKRLEQPQSAPVVSIDGVKAARWWERATGVELGSFLRRRQELHPLLDEQAPLGIDQVEVDGRFMRSEALVALHAEFRALVEARAPAASGAGRTVTA